MWPIKIGIHSQIRDGKTHFKIWEGNTVKKEGKTYVKIFLLKKKEVHIKKEGSIYISLFQKRRFSFV